MKARIRKVLFAISVVAAISANAAERVTYFIPDAQGSTVAAMDERGDVVWRESYAPYGNRTKNASASDGKSGYTGKPEEPVTGLVYMGARWYDPDIGRFTGIDPQGFNDDNPQTFGRYLYGNNSPYVYVDPDGEIAFLAPLAILAVKEAGGMAFEATTGLPAVFSVKGLAKTISKHSGGDEGAYRMYKLFAEKVDVSTARDGAVVYSGRGNRELAEAFARDHGKKTLEMTKGGAMLDAQNLFGDANSLSFWQARDVWSTISQRYADGASGSVVGFVKGARPDGIFNAIEDPAFRRNPNVTNLITGGN